MLLDDPLDCGGPPQTDRSGRREKRDHAHGATRLIEIVNELLKVFGIDRKERPLTRGRFAAAVKIIGESGESQHESEKDPPAAIHFTLPEAPR